ncbi:hypothetical protein ZWY2020_047082 [Hordeum vulgare]|nr:hypothetical protein ZWY2020_047082 [Hordeum vulgare]
MPAHVSSARRDRDQDGSLLGRKEERRAEDKEKRGTGRNVMGAPGGGGEAAVLCTRAERTLRTGGAGAGLSILCGGAGGAEKMCPSREGEGEGACLHCGDSGTVKQSCVR